MSAYEDVDGIDGPWEGAMARAMAEDAARAKRDACDHEDRLMLPAGGYICGTCAVSWTGGAAPRLDLVAHIRQGIENGTYKLTKGKIKVVVDKIEEELGK